MPESLTRTVVKGTVWSAIGRFGVMGLQFITYMVLAHLLTPNDFGAIGMLAIFIVVSQNLVDGGFNSALIQKKSPTELDYSTIFLWCIGFGTFLCLLLYLVAPFVARFYRMSILCPALQVMGISIIFNGAVSIQNARLQKAMQFRKLAIIDISTNIAAGIGAVATAYHGGGIWSLVTLMMTQSIGKLLVLFLVTRWFPKLKFSSTVFKQLFSFGGFIFVCNILETISNNIQGLIIGRKFSAAQTGYYAQASKMENIIGTSIPQIIVTVMYPLFSKFQNENDKLQSLITTNLRVISFTVYPILSILIIYAPQIITLMFGSQWLPSAPYYRILCSGAFFYCLNNINFYAVASKGKSKEIFYGTIYRFVVLGILIAIGINFGMIGLMCSLALNMCNIFFTNAVLCRRYVGQSLKKELKAILPTATLCITSSTITITVCHYLSIWWGGGIVLFIFTYITLSMTLQVQAYNETKNILSKLKKQHSS